MAVREKTSTGRQIVVVGAGGHGRVVASLCRSLNFSVIGFIDPRPSRVEDSRTGPEVLGSDDVLVGLDRRVEIAIGLGSFGKASRRHELFAYVRELGFAVPVLVHPNAWVDTDTDLADGVQVMAGCVVQAGSHIGANSIINTGATIDHDCVLERGVHVAPGTVLCGTVHVGDYAFIGARSVVRQGVRIGANASVGMGSVVVTDVPDDASGWGVPFRRH